jgi:hypothetical protein
MSNSKRIRKPLPDLLPAGDVRLTDGRVLRYTGTDRSLNAAGVKRWQCGGLVVTGMVVSTPRGRLRLVGLTRGDDWPTIEDMDAVQAALIGGKVWISTPEPGDEYWVKMWQAPADVAGTKERAA